MDRLVAVDKWLTRVLESILILFFAVFLVLVCVLVVMRYGFAASIIGGNEFVTIAFLFTSAIGGAVGITRHEHIAITFLIDYLPVAPKKIIYAVGLVLVAVINGYMVYYSYNWIDQAGHNPWQPFGWPQGLVHAAIPIGCSLAIIFCFVKIVLVFGNREQVDTLWLPED